MKTSAILRKKMWRETLSGWKQFSAIIAIGGIAVTLFVGLLSNSQSLSTRVDTFFAEGNAADIYVTTSSYSWVDRDNIEKLLDDEDAMESRFEMTCRVDGSSMYSAISGQRPNISTVVEDFGHLESQDDSNFFILDKMKSKQFESESLAKTYNLGDEVPVTYSFGAYVSDEAVSFLDDYLLSGQSNPFKQESLSLNFQITGFATLPENVTTSSYNASTFLLSKKAFRAKLYDLLASRFSADGLTYITDMLGWGNYENDAADPAASLPDYFPQSNQYLIKLADSNTRDGKEAAINDYFSAKGSQRTNLMAITDRSSNPWSMAVDTDVLEAKQLTFVFPFVFFLVALLVILTTISQIILKERTEIGTMKAIGLSKREIYRHYISMTLSVVGIGTLIGCILGPIIIPFIMGQKYDILYTLPTRQFFVFPWWQALLTAALFLGSAALVTILVCRKEIALTPAQSMRPAPIEFRAHRRLLSHDKKPESAKSLSVKMAFRNLRVNLVKSLMVIVGVMGCTALLVCGFGIEDTLNHGIEIDTAIAYSSDLTLSYSSPQTASRAPDLLAAYPDDIEMVQEYLGTATSVSYKKEGEVTSSSFSTTLRVFDRTLQEGNSFQVDFPRGSLAISNKVASQIGAAAGDAVSFTYDGVAYEGTVGVVYESFTVHGIAAYYQDYPEMFPSSDDYVYSSLFMNLVDGVEAESFLATLEKDEAFPYISGGRTQAGMKEEIKDIMSGIYIMTNAVKVFAILLAVVVLYNLALLNFRERTRDIATLKVLGFSKGEIGLSLMMESLSLAALGVLLGSFLGYPFMYLVLLVNRVSLVEFLYYIYPITYLYSFLITFVVAFLVNLYLSNWTNKVKMVESLKSVE